MEYLGYAYAAAGRAHDARKVLKELESHRRDQYVSRVWFRLIHDALGEKESALAALQRALKTAPSSSHKWRNIRRSRRSRPNYSSGRSCWQVGSTLTHVAGRSSISRTWRLDVHPFQSPKPLIALAPVKSEGSQCQDSSQSLVLHASMCVIERQFGVTVA
jgi:tetratricopeptide (TPR) repeat protein